VVNCTNGDVNLQSIRGEVEKTSFAVAGEVAGKTNPHSKVASLQVNDAGGRIEDWLRLLAPEQTPAMTGPISFQAHVTVPGGRRPFIQRVRLGGDFELTGVAFTKEKSQHGVSELSLRAQGQKLADENESLPKILGNLSGHVDLFDGVAHFSQLSFTVPGAQASMHGTYSFIDERIDLHGQLELATKFSATATGPKGLVTRVVEPLFAKSRGKGEILPVKLTGSYDHPSYGLDK
jgi:AsmA-like C-terminal region